MTARDIYVFFFFNDTATTEIYTLSLHDALPIFHWRLPSLSATRVSHCRVAPGQSQQSRARRVPDRRTVSARTCDAGWVNPYPRWDLVVMDNVAPPAVLVVDQRQLVAMLAQPDDDRAEAA